MDFVDLHPESAELEAFHYSLEEHEKTKDAAGIDSISQREKIAQFHHDVTTFEAQIRRENREHLQRRFPSRDGSSD